MSGLNAITALLGLLLASATGSPILNLDERAGAPIGIPVPSNCHILYYVAAPGVRFRPKMSMSAQQVYQYFVEPEGYNSPLRNCLEICYSLRDNQPWDCLSVYHAYNVPPLAQFGADPGASGVACLSYKHTLTPADFDILPKGSGGYDNITAAVLNCPHGEHFPQPPRA